MCPIASYGEAWIKSIGMSSVELRARISTNLVHKRDTEGKDIHRFERWALFASLEFPGDTIRKPPPAKASKQVAGVEVQLRFQVITLRAPGYFPVIVVNVAAGKGNKPAEFQGHVEIHQEPRNVILEVGVFQQPLG